MRLVKCNVCGTVNPSAVGVCDVCSSDLVEDFTKQTPDDEVQEEDRKTMKKKDKPKTLQAANRKIAKLERSLKQYSYIYSLERDRLNDLKLKLGRERLTRHESQLDYASAISALRNELERTKEEYARVNESLIDYSKIEGQMLATYVKESAGALFKRAFKKLWQDVKAKFTREVN